MPQYQGVWTLEAQAQALTKQQWVTDPNFKNTTLLLQADGTGSGSQNQSFLDSSTNNFFIARFGNTTQGSFTPFSQAPGYWSNYFDGSSWISVPDSTDLDLASGTSWTIEAWVYNTGSSGIQNIMGSQNSAGDVNFLIGIGASNELKAVWCNNTPTAYTVSAPSAVIRNTWIHVAAVNNAGTLSLYVNGVSVGTPLSISGTFRNLASVVAVGRSGDYASQYWVGYISNARIVNGTALYTSNFTPSTTPFTDVANTKLLTCQSNRFVDTNTQVTAKTITIGGTPSVQAFGPFAPALQWTPDVVGGSGYFDGSDYLSVSQAAGNFGTSNFSVECFYCNSAAYSGTVYPRIVSKSIVTSAPSGAWGLSTRNGTTDEVYFAYYNASFVNVGTGINVNDFAWHHLLVTYDGSRIRVFVDGILRGNAVPTISSFGTATGDPVLIGYQSREGNYINGYVSGLRITNGSIPTSYQTASTTNGTTIFTPPTAPPTTSSQGAANVSLLTNYTNAGIYDGAMDNVLETVGDAQVATAPVKYGSGSIKFDGTGDYLKSNSGTDAYAFGSGDFTIECWVYFNTVASQVFYDGRPSGVQTTQPAIYMSGAGVLFYYVNGANVITGATLTSGQWYHVAVCRANSQTRMFLNGVQTGSTYADTTVYTNTAGRPVIGIDGFNLSNPLNGYIDDMRVTKGVARYIANFTPPQQALPRQ